MLEDDTNHLSLITYHFSKALFIGVPIARIVGLRRRLNPDLSRMARDYASERRAAGRTVPADLSLALHDARIEEPVS